MPNRLSRAVALIAVAVLLNGSLAAQAQPEGFALPEGSTLIFQTAEKILNEPLQSEIVRSGPDPSGPRQPVCPHTADDLHPRLDAEKQRVVFASDRQTAQDYDLYLADLASGSCAQLTGLAIDGSDDLAPAWSPDGSQIVFERRLAGGGRDLVRIDLASGVETALGLTAVSPSGPVWSPDGLELLFACTVDEAEVLCRMGSGPGPDPEPLPVDPGWVTSRLIGPVWSPDGQRAAFTRVSATVDDEIWVVELETEHYQCVYGDSAGCTADRETGFDIRVNAWAEGDGLLLTEIAPAIDAATPTWSRMRALALADGSLSELSNPGVFEANPDWRAALPAQLWIRFTGLAAQVQAGDPFWVEWEYGNRGDLTAALAQVELAMPEAFSVIQAEPPAGIGSSGSAGWTLGQVPAGSSGTLKVLLQTGGPPGQVTLGARIFSETDPTGQVVSAQIEILAAPATATPSATQPLPTPNGTLRPTDPAGTPVPVFLPLLAGP